MLVNLISKRRPDQQKLVGRITIDLAQIANSTGYRSLQEHQLEYCSVDAFIVFKGKLFGKKLSSTSPENFDQDSFNDYQSFIAGLHRDHRSKGQTTHDTNEERTIEFGNKFPNKDISWKGKREDLEIERNIIEESNNEDL